MADFIDVSNKNNHAGVERREASEKAEAILKLINEYRVYANRFENLPTWDVLGFLNKLQKELFERYGEDVNNGELDKVRNEYFLLVGKKPFMAWKVEDLKKKMEEFREEAKEKNKLSDNYLNTYKKSEWRKALKK
jgi:hypothetical protein